MGIFIEYEEENRGLDSMKLMNEEEVRMKMTINCSLDTKHG